MINARNEFETVEAFTHIAGSSFGTWTDRETTAELIRVLSLVTNHGSIDRYWKELATTPDDSNYFYELQEEIVDELNYYMGMPAYCTVTLEDNEWMVRPYLEDELERVEDTPEKYVEDHLLQVNDHGNVTCLEWNPVSKEYEELWSIV